MLGDGVGADEADHDDHRPDDRERNAQDRGEERHGRTARAPRRRRCRDTSMAIRPQTKSGRSTNSIGPGFRPQIIRPPIITAAVAEPGMPSASIGSIALGAGRVVGGLRRDDALGLALAELGRVAREAPGEAVAHEGRGRRPAGRDPHPAADRRWSAAARPSSAAACAMRLQHVARADARLHAVEAQPFLHRERAARRCRTGR